MKIPKNMTVPAQPMGFPPSFLACPECDWIMTLLSSDVTSHYQCSDGCQKHWTFQRIPWNHPQFYELNKRFPNITTRILFGRADDNWSAGMLPVVIECACCGIGKVGYWTPEATSGFYILDAWPEKTPTIEQSIKHHRGWESGRGNSFLCDECSTHETKAADPSPQASPEPRFAPFMDPPHADLLTADDWMHLHVDYDVQGPDRGYIGYIRKDNGQLLSIEDVVQLYGDYVERFVRESRVTAPVGQLSIESAETIAVNLIEEVLKLQRQGYTHYCKSNMAQMIKAGVEAALASPPQIAQPELLSEVWQTLSDVCEFHDDPKYHLDVPAMRELMKKVWAASAQPPQIAQPLNPSDCDCNHQHASHSFCRSKGPSRGMIPENERVYPAAQPSQVSAEQFFYPFALSIVKPVGQLATVNHERDKAAFQESSDYRAELVPHNRNRASRICRSLRIFQSSEGVTNASKSAITTGTPSHC